MSEIRRELQQFIERTGTPASRISREALGDPGAVGRIIRDEMIPRPETIARLRYWMRQNPNGMGEIKPGRYMMVKRIDESTIPAPVHRDPCWRCGSRGDVPCGCGGYRNTSRMTR